MNEQFESTGGVDPWRGVSFSGVTLVIGVGTGRQAALLAERCREADGLLIVSDAVPRRLASLRAALKSSRVSWLRARLRTIPLAHESVDLVLVNGLLRETPANRLGHVCEELWRVLVPGGQVRVADILEASDEPEQRAWAERNRIIRRLALALSKPAAVAADIKAAAQALRLAGFEEQRIALLPGYGLTDSWLKETAAAIHEMAGRVVDSELRRFIVNEDIERLARAYASGGQRAPERFVLQASKPGDLTVAMESPFTENDLVPSID